MIAIISIIFGAIELLVALRFIFLFLGANPQAGFVGWVYDLSTPLIAPFAGILGQPIASPRVVTSVHSVFDPSTLIALVVYAAVGAILIRLFVGHRSV